MTRAWTAGHRRAVAAALATVPAALLTVLPATGTASAHVTASAPDAAPGGYSVVTLRVPDESAAGTVKLEVTLPPDHPFAEVRTAPVPGWDTAVRRTALAQPIDDGAGGKLTEVVSAVTFTARDGGAIGPGQFGEFRLLLGPLPKSGNVFLPAVQTYSDGSTVSWIERSTDGTESAHPAPVLHLGGPVVTGHTHGAPPPTLATGSDDTQHNSADTATFLAGAALVVALLGLATAAYPLLRVRTARPAADPSGSSET